MRKAAAADLKRSGISVQQAEYAEMYSTKNASLIYSDFKKLPALVIPYLDPWTDDFMKFERDGKLLPFCRIRYYGDSAKTKSFKKSKPVRYTQPAGSGVHPYFPVCKSVNWLEVLADPTIPIMITEGEKKALAACLLGIPTIGLGGVYNFTSGGALLPLLDRVKWKGRSIFICYDSDVETNNQIQVAEARLTMELTQRSADVFRMRLPESKEGHKVGIDDFIMAQGEEELFKLVDAARGMSQMDRQVLLMNEVAAWVEAEGLIYDRANAGWIKKADFTLGSKFSVAQVAIPKAKGAGTRKLSVAAAWLKHPLAKRYESVLFKPGTNQLEIQTPSGGIALNSFLGLEGIPGDVKPFFELHNYLLSKTDEFDIDLPWKTICYHIQNPEARIDIGLMFIGPQGSGKSIWAKIMCQMVQPYGKIMFSKGLDNDYNGWVEKSLIVSLVEAKAFLLKRNLGTLKALITDKRQPMNEKYRVERDVDSHAFYIFSSNETSAAAFEDDDRRMVIIDCPKPHPRGPAFYKYIGAWLKNDGPMHLLDYFQNYDLKGWTPPDTAPRTRAKRMAYIASLTPVQKLVDYIKKEPDNFVMTSITSSLEWAYSDPVDKVLAAQVASQLPTIPIRPFYTPQELAVLFPQTSNTLKAAGDLAGELLQGGIPYLKCTDNLDGFMHKGVIQQFFIISNLEEFPVPISQKKFENYMVGFPTYKQLYDEIKKQKRNRKSKRKRKNNS